MSISRLSEGLCVIALFLPLAANMQQQCVTVDDALQLTTKLRDALLETKRALEERADALLPHGATSTESVAVQQPPPPPQQLEDDQLVHLIETLESIERIRKQRNEERVHIATHIARLKTDIAAMEQVMHSLQSLTNDAELALPRAGSKRPRIDAEVLIPSTTPSKRSKMSWYVAGAAATAAALAWLHRVEASALTARAWSAIASLLKTAN